MLLINKKKKLQKCLRIQQSQLKMLNQHQNLLKLRSLNRIKKHSQSPETFGQSIKSSK